MKRDMDLIRKLLLDIETREDRPDPHSIQIEGFDQDAILHHIILLKDAGLLLGPPPVEYLESMMGPSLGSATSSPALDHTFFCLSWAGHEFLDEARDDTTWNRAKTIVKEKSGGLSFELLKTVLVEWGKHAVTIATVAAGS
jgi:hypothetical protein